MKAIDILHRLHKLNSVL